MCYIYFWTSIELQKFKNNNKPCDRIKALDGASSVMINNVHTK